MNGVNFPNSTHDSSDIEFTTKGWHIYIIYGEEEPRVPHNYSPMPLFDKEMS